MCSLSNFINDTGNISTSLHKMSDNNQMIKFVLLFLSACQNMQHANQLHMCDLYLHFLKKYSRNV